MKLTVLGCLGACPYKGEGTSSCLLESEDFHLLIGAGSTTLVRLENYLDPLRLGAVVLSYYHHDHIVDLGVLRYYHQFYPTLEPTPILPIYGHTQDQMHFKELTLPSVSGGREYLEAEELAVGPFLVTFMETIHPVTCYAMRTIEKATGKVFVFIGDSGYLANFENFAKDADLFLTDMYLFEGNERRHAHFTPREAGEIVKAAQVRQLVLIHLPRHGSLEQPREEAQNYAGTEIPVTLTQPDLIAEI